MSTILAASGRKSFFRHRYAVYISLWLVVFVLYLPAIHAGFVADTTGWLSNLHTLSFKDYLNDSMSTTKSMYQLTQLVTWLLFQVLGTHIILWRLLFVSLQALNAWFAFVLVSGLLTATGMELKRAKIIAITGSILFCVSPHITEVVVWNAAYHYLQGIGLMLGILLLAQRYTVQQKAGYAWLAGSLFLLSTFSLELFYLTPWILFTMLLFYRFAAGVSKSIFLRTVFFFFVPLLLVFVVRLLLYRAIYGKWTPHVQQIDWTAGDRNAYFAKPFMYLFHLLAMGRFFPQEIRMQVYGWCQRPKALVMGYGLLAAIIIYVVVRIRRFTPAAKVAALCYVWVCGGLVILLPLWFYNSFLVTFDRYLYHLCIFFYFIPVLLISLIRARQVRNILTGAIILIHLYFTLFLVRYWHQSTQAIASLQLTFPEPGGRTILLLDLPYNLRGIPMIPSFNSSEFRLMHNELFPPAITTKTYDVLSFNMLTRNDGAHIQVKNDSTLTVTLNQWGTWWWHNDLGAVSYETEDYRMNLVDPGHWYELTLKHPNNGYLLLYQAAGHWKAVNWSIKNADQY